MFKKTITFTDFNGDTQTKDFYFHLSKAELAAMGAGGDAMMSRLQRIIDAKDGLAILEEYRKLIRLACGVRSEDGQRFIKTPDTQSDLLDSPAFDELLMELFTTTTAATEFINQLVPQKMLKEMMTAAEKSSGDETPQEDTRPDWIKEGRTPTHAELRDATPDQIQLAFRQSGK
jgi:hypothetical protein